MLQVDGEAYTSSIQRMHLIVSRAIDRCFDARIDNTSTGSV